MLNKRFLPVLLLPLFLAQAAPPSTASTAPAATQRDAQSQQCNVFLAPFIDDQTMFVGHLDASAIDTGAIEAFIAAIFDNMKLPADDLARTKLPMVRTAANVFLARFKQLGGRHVFLVLNQEDIYPAMSGPAIIIKVEAGGDAKGIVALINATMGENGPHIVVRDNAVIIGEDPTQKRLETFKPAVRQDLKFSAGDEAAEGVVALTADQRRVLHDFLPNLPEEIGGGSVDILTQDVFNVSLKLRLPPTPGAWITFSMKAGASGAALAQWITHIRDTILGDKNFDRDLDNDPVLKEFANDIRTLIREVLTPVTGGMSQPRLDLVTLSLTDKQVQRMTLLLTPALGQSRTVALRTQSMSNIKQLLQLAVIYSAEHNDMLPANMDELTHKAAVQPDPKSLINPLDPKHRAYVYRPWTVKLGAITNPAGVPIVWEDADDLPDGRNVGFADGHVEWMRHEDFKKVMAETEAWAKTLKQ